MNLFVTGSIVGGSLDVPDTITANSFHVDTTGNTWWGNTVIGSAVAKVLNTGAATFTNITITGVQAGSSIDGQYLTAGSVTPTSANLALQGWTQTCAFTSTDSDTISWGAGIFTSSDGTAYNISAGNTGNMSARTYIYLNIAISTTAYQTTTTAATAIGSGKCLVAVAENGASVAEFQVYGGIGGIKLNVDDLAANSASTNEFVANTANIANAIITDAKIASLDVSKLTAGSITSKAITLAVAEGTGDSKLQAGKTDFTNTDSGFILGIDDSDSNKAKFYIGDNTYHLSWDGAILSVNDSVLSNQDIYGDGSDGDVTTAGNVSLTKDMYYNNLTVSAGDILNPSGYRIFVKNTLTVNGKLAREGNAGGNGTNSGGLNTPGTGGAALAAATLPGGIAGVTGGNGSGNYTNCAGQTSGANGSSQSICLGNNGVAGGGGGDGTSGGIGGTATPSVQGAGILSFLQLGREFVAGGINLFTVSPGCGAGGGGCNHIFGADPGPAGGGSGSSGGYVLISAKQIVIGAAGEISVKGGDGGDGGNGISAASSGAGGGAGGNGGVLAIVYGLLENNGAITSSGGVGGTGGNGTGGFNNGVNGNDGADGKLILLQR